MGGKLTIRASPKLTKVVLLILGIPALIAGEPPNLAVPIQSESARGAADTTKPLPVRPAGPIKQTAPPRQEAPCRSGHYENDDDLCAQWKAADAASEAARYSFWALITSGLGTVLLLWTLWETREISRRELRAYLRVEPTGEGIVQPDRKITLPFHIINYGSTPAINCCVQSSLVVRSPDWDWTKEPERVETLQNAPSITIHPDSPSLIKLEMNDPLPREIHKAILEGKAVVFGRGHVAYQDMFRRKRHTSFQIEFHGADAGRSGTGGHIRISARGNDFS
jgi:hypothetical protein